MAAERFMIARVQVQVWAGWAAIIVGADSRRRRIKGPAVFDLGPGDRFESFVPSKEGRP